MQHNAPLPGPYHSVTGVPDRVHPPCREQDWMDARPRRIHRRHRRFGPVLAVRRRVLHRGGRDALRPRAPHVRHARQPPHRLPPAARIGPLGRTAPDQLARESLGARERRRARGRLDGRGRCGGSLVPGRIDRAHRPVSRSHPRSRRHLLRRGIGAAPRLGGPVLPGAARGRPNGARRNRHSDGHRRRDPGAAVLDASRVGVVPLRGSAPGQHDALSRSAARGRTRHRHRQSRVCHRQRCRALR